MANLKEYAIIVKNSDDLHALYHELEHAGCGAHDCCPDRCVECAAKTNKNAHTNSYSKTTTTN